MQTLDRGLRILHLLAQAPEGRTVSELSFGRLDAAGEQRVVEAAKRIASAFPATGRPAS